MNNKENRVPNLYPIISVLATLGGLISIWQTKGYFATRDGMGAFHSFCNIGQTFDCTAIEISPYSEFFAGFPVSAVAIAGYILILILSLFGLSETHKKGLRPFMVAFASISVIFSVAYLFIMVTLIKKLCLLCLGVDLMNVSILAVALRLPQSEKSSNGFSIVHVIGSGLAALFIAFLFSKGLDPFADLKAEDINDSVESVLSAPVVPFEVPADAPVIGDPAAPITVVKFSDYECPACKLGATAIHPLFKRYPKEVKFVFVNYPLDQACNNSVPRKMHEFACEAATVAICATEQGKFQETYETLFENQQSFEHSKIADLLVSKVEGMDANKLKACMNLPSTSDKILRDVELGGKNRLNIQSTPTFYINGKKIEGVLPTVVWIKLIDRMLAQVKK